MAGNEKLSSRTRRRGIWAVFAVGAALASFGCGGFLPNHSDAVEVEARLARAVILKIDAGRLQLHRWVRP